MEAPALITGRSVAAAAAAFRPLAPPKSDSLLSAKNQILRKCQTAGEFAGAVVPRLGSAGSDKCRKCLPDNRLLN